MMPSLMFQVWHIVAEEDEAGSCMLVMRLVPVEVFARLKRQCIAAKKDTQSV